MSNRPVPLVAALSGLASVVLMFVGSAVGSAGGNTDLTSSRAEIMRWLSKQNGGAGHYAGGMLELLGILAFILFAATLWSVLRDADGDRSPYAATAFGAGLAAATVKLASVSPLFAAVWRHKQGVSPQLGAALVDMNNVAFVLTWTLDAVMLAAAAAVVLRHAVLPRWLGWFGAATAVILIVSAPAADHVPPLGFLLALLWTAAVSVVLTRRTLRRGRERATVAAIA